MNFFHSLFKSKLDAMRAAAPRAGIHLLHESNGFSIYLDEAAAVRKITQLGTLTDHAEDILEETVPVLFIPLEECVRFVEEVTTFHSVGLVDVILADKIHTARYVMYAYFGKRPCAELWQKLVEQEPLRQRALITSITSGAVPYDAENLRHFNPVPEALQFLAPVVALPTLLAEKDSLDADFWG